MVPAMQSPMPLAAGLVRPVARRFGGPRVLVPLALLTVYTIWSSTYLALRWVVMAYPPMLSAGARFVLAGSALFLIARWQGASIPSRGDVARAILPGILLFLVGNGFVSMAEREVSSAEAAIVCGAMPLVMVLMGALVGERPRRVEVVGLVLGFAGLTVMTLGPLSAVSRLNGASVLLLLAPFGWALGSRLTRRQRLQSSVMSAALPMILGGLAALLLGVVLGERLPSASSSRASLSWLYLVVAGSMVAFTAYAYLLRNARPSVATSYAYVNPTIAALLGVLLGGETVRLQTLLGGGLVVLGVGAVVALRSEGNPEARSAKAAANELAVAKRS
jgi:drug/metabolite transporter (DMT)-like permease